MGTALTVSGKRVWMVLVPVGNLPTLGVAEYLLNASPPSYRSFSLQLEPVSSSLHDDIFLYGCDDIPMQFSTGLL